MANAMQPQNLQENIFRIPPFKFIHVLDHTTNVTRVELGPKTFVRQDNEQVILGQQMIVIPPNHYCTIQNPVLRQSDGTILKDNYGQAKLKHADFEVRLEQDPFPLYPGEVLFCQVTPLTVVRKNTALLLCAVQGFDDGTTERVAGDQWLFEGPGVYTPRKEATAMKTIEAIIVKSNEALKIRAILQTNDRDGKSRVAGEEWLVKGVGSYLMGAYEELVEVVEAHVLTDKLAIHVKAMKTFTDEFNKLRKNGEEWLISITDTETYIPDVYVDVTAEVEITTLSNREYCVITNPIGPDGKPQLGQKKLVKGETSFFLNPGEECYEGIQECFVLSENEGLVLKAEMAFEDTSVKPTLQRRPGDKWLIRGPLEYIPPIEVQVLIRREAIPLDENEGVYVRNLKTGKIRAVSGQTYMLNQDEEVWQKELPPAVLDLLKPDRDNLGEQSLLRFAPPQIPGFGAVANANQSALSFAGGSTLFGAAPGGASPFKVTMAPKKKTIKRKAVTKGGKHGPIHVKKIKPNVVTYRVPHNAVVQVYDFKEKKARIIYGPDLVLLGPDEQFTQLSLSGGCPKETNKIRSLCLLLGPDFCTDRITVETADHARLQLQVSYNWHFDVSDRSLTTSAKLFNVPDFVGDFCKAIASRIRAAVACTTFDDFHKHSANIIRSAVFGQDEKNKIRNVFVFPQNNLCITSIDIQSVEPVDERTRDALQKSVQLAIEITTQSQEATAKHEAMRQEQEAKGKLERQRIDDEVEAEKVKKGLLELQAESIAVESCGQAKADALSRAEALQIEGAAAVLQAKSKAQAIEIESEVELQRLIKARDAEIIYTQKINELEVSKAKELYELEINKFKEMVTAIGPNTIQAIALAGPELQVKLLQGLGLKSTLLTDGKTPVNLFTTAQGLLGNLNVPNDQK